MNDNPQLRFALYWINPDGSEKRKLYATKQEADDDCARLKARGFTAWVARS